MPCSSPLECVLQHRRCIEQRCEHVEVSALRRRSDTVLFTVCVNYTLSNATLPRWQRYAEIHGYDWLWVSARNLSITGIATAAWDRVFIAQQLFRRGYLDVMHVDGDSAVLAWETPIGAYVRNATGPFGAAPASSFLYVSQDVGRFGRYWPSERDFRRGISLHTDFQLTGPNNFGIWLMRNHPNAHEALAAVISHSQNPGRSFQKFPAEQGTLNAWLGENCTCHSARGTREAKRNGTTCHYAQAPYGTFQRFLGRLDNSVHHKPQDGWESNVSAVLRSYREAGVIVLHMPSMQLFQGFLRLTFSAVERLFPIGSIATAIAKV